jgi:DNA polymerase-3 subunit delta'
MSFASLPRPQPATQALQRSLHQGRLGHAYLLSGQDLPELETVARTLAKTLNCAKREAKGPERALPDSCDGCDSCRRIDGEVHPDVSWIRPESKSRVITIDQIRELLRTFHLKPLAAAYKVAVVVAADRLNAQAGNAFLKTLEEPPSRSVLILLSNEPQRILETILSRCLRLTFVGESLPRLPEESAACLATFASHAANKSPSLFNRYRALDAVLQRLAAIRAEVEDTLRRQSSLERVPEADSALRDKWEEELLAAVEAEYRRRRAELLTAFEWWLRDIWLATLGSGEGLSAYPQLGAAAGNVARRISPHQACSNLQAIEQLQRLLATNVQEALALEVGFLGLHL